VFFFGKTIKTFAALGCILSELSCECVWECGDIGIQDLAENLLTKLSLACPTGKLSTKRDLKLSDQTQKCIQICRETTIKRTRNRCT